MNTQICTKCGKTKDISDFYFRKEVGTFRKICKECNVAQQKIYVATHAIERQKYHKQYHQDHKNERSVYRKQYYKDNKDYENTRNKKYAEEHKNELSKYYQQYRDEHKKEFSIYEKEYSKKNAGKIKRRKAKYSKNRKTNDPTFKLRAIISTKVATVLKNNGSSKNGDSILQNVSYTIDDLRKYLENQFESWMTWENYGRYRAKNWDDNDQTTWTWQLDHIIPQSNLPYTSMIDENFKKSWALSNLRPLSSKQNLIDGITKIRHKKDQMISEDINNKLSTIPNEKYRKFFGRFDEIETLNIVEWRVVHLLAYFCKKYKEAYGIDYSWKFNNPTPSKCFEVWQMNTLAAKLSARPQILKEYIDWVYQNVVPKASRRLTSISFMTKDDVVNNYKVNILLAPQNATISRTTLLPNNYIAILKEAGYVGVDT